jgi:GNAT superfamily N-acetyltransferase
MKNIFERGLNLFDGVIYDPIIKHPTFSHIKSIFCDEWYNFIVPKVSPDKLNWSETSNVIKSQKEIGISMSYYIPDNLSQLYKDYFTKDNKHTSTSSDYYICKHVDAKSTPIGQLFLVDDSSLKILIGMAKICFPEWPNNEQYARHMYEHQKSNSHKIVRNYLLKQDNNLVGFCGLIASQVDNLSYFHNMGVLPEFRRKGYFTAMVEHLINISIEYGISDTYGLVENGSGSYHGLTQLGYVVEDKYHLFST